MWTAGDVKDCSWKEIETLTVLILHYTMTSDCDPGMWKVTQRCACSRCIVQRPLPARLVCGTSKSNPRHMNDLHAPEGKLSDFVRIFKWLRKRFVVHVPFPVRPSLMLSA